MSLAFLINQKSGGGAGERLLSSLQELIAQGKLIATAHALDFAELDSQLELALRNERVIIGGGDGTISSVVERFVSSRFCDQIRAMPTFALGILPLGTGNDLARELGITSVRHPVNLERLAERYSQARTQSVDIWQVLFADGSRRILCNYLSVGFDAAVVSHFANTRFRDDILRRGGKWGNRLRYFASAVRNSLYWLSLEGVEISGSSGVVRHPKWCRSIIVSNTRSIMGLGKVNRESDVSDGVLEVGVTRFIADYIRMMIASAISGFAAHPRGRYDSVTIRGLRSDDPIQIDGEPITGVNTSEISIAHATTLNFLI